MCPFFWTLFIVCLLYINNLQKGGENMANEELNSTQEVINRLKQIISYSATISGAMADAENILEHLANSVIAAKEMADEITLHANSALFDECL